MRKATTALDANVIATTTQMAARSHMASAVTPAMRAPTAQPRSRQSRYADRRRLTVESRSRRGVGYLQRELLADELTMDLQRRACVREGTIR